MIVIKHLKPSSPLLARVKNGLGALKAADKSRIEEPLTARVEDSIDIDAAFREQAPNDNRWDYLIGDGTLGKVIALEPHSAKQDEVTRVIAKKKKAREQLREHWKAESPVVAWFWIASGDVHFPDTDRNAKRLAQENITFVGKQLKAKHLNNL